MAGTKGKSAGASNTDDFEEYRKQYMTTTPWIGHVDAKVDMAAPYHLFLTRIKDSPDTYDEDLTITFPELLDSSLGELEHSLHINFMVEFDWLLAQYMVTGYRNPSMTILYDSIDRSIPKNLNINGIRVQSPFSFGHHHTKMSVFFYTDKSVRFAIYTANLIESDWENRTQGVWISPVCPFLGNGVPINYGESETLFKYEMLKYLNSYHLPQLRSLLTKIQKIDASEIRVFLVPSVPGEVRNNECGFLKMHKIIREHVPLKQHSWDLIAQCSSIGSLGSDQDSWLTQSFSKNMSGSDTKVFKCPVRLIYPSIENVRESHDGLIGGSCLPYQSTTHKKQLWLRKILYHWKSDHRHRSKAVPHIKSYTKLSPDGEKLSWFLLSSANLSKAAWGRTLVNGKVKILSYELGVLFLPHFLIGKKFFKIKRGGSIDNDRESFPVPYDIPLKAYREYDDIFLFDKCYNN